MDATALGRLSNATDSVLGGAGFRTCPSAGARLGSTAEETYKSAFVSVEGKAKTFSFLGKLARLAMSSLRTPCVMRCLQVASRDTPVR